MREKYQFEYNLPVVRGHQPIRFSVSSCCCDQCRLYIVADYVMAGGQFLLFAALCILIARAQEAQDDTAIVAAGEENVFRLPEFVHPLHYKLRIVTHLDDEEGFKFTGKVWIKVSKQEVDLRTGLKSPSCRPVITNSREPRRQSKVVELD